MRRPAFPVDIVDPSGAGAAFHGAFAAALLGQLPFAECMPFASAAASLCCRRLGGLAGVPQREEVIALLRDAAPP